MITNINGLEMAGRPATKSTVRFVSKMVVTICSFLYMGNIYL